MLEHLQTRREILFDLTANYLEPLQGCFHRLAYLVSLYDPSSGRYAHDRLGAVYGEEPINEVLAACHEEIFERLLESPLSSQEENLRRYLNSLPGAPEDNFRKCQASVQGWIPARAPEYLKELFCSNLAALLELLQEGKTSVRSGK